MSGLLAYDARFRADLPLYCRRLVRIQTKQAGGLVPLELNDAQLRVHAMLERQKSRTGMVRAIVLKARQMGISTYIAARYYHQTSLWPGRNTYILTHEDDATRNLFRMAKTMHDNMPAEYRPAEKANNANELLFGGLKSGYRVGTAQGTLGTGRSQTNHLFHGSEAAFWKNADEHYAAVMQSVPDAAGTEVVIESTAVGPMGKFYEEWVKAERGEGVFMPVFLPWHEHAEYRSEPPRGWEPSVEWREYGELHRLDRAQVHWAWRKNSTLGRDEDKIAMLFRREYPASAAEAFQSATEGSLIPNEHVLRARRVKLDPHPLAPRVLGVDIGRGGDTTRLIDRKGRVLGGLVNETITVPDLAVVTDRIGHLLNTHDDIRCCFIDITGLGAGVHDFLRDMFGDRVEGVNFGERAHDQEKYRNRRAEMWDRMRLWFADKAGVAIPDEDEAQRHLTAPQFRYTSKSSLILESKEDIRKRLKFSPDFGDAAALTFARILPMMDHAPKWQTSGFMDKLMGANDPRMSWAAHY